MEESIILRRKGNQTPFLVEGGVCLLLVHHCRSELYFVFMLVLCTVSAG